jgi:hypothetical protein
MISAISIAGAIGVLWLVEGSLKRMAFAIAALCFSAALLLFIVADIERAVLLSAMLTVAVSSASRIKYQHSGLKLIVTDFPLLFAGTAKFLVIQYPLAVAALVLGGLAIAVAAAATSLWLAGASVSFDTRLIVFAVALIALAATHRMAGGAASFQRTVTEPRGFLEAVRRPGSDRYRQRPAAADGGRCGARHRHAGHHCHPA